MKIVITTGSVPQNFKIIDAIFAMDSHQESWLFSSSADPARAFDGVKKQLRERCEALGGDAVVNCQFEYRNAIGDGLIGKKQVIEIFAYGTAVKYVDETEQTKPAPSPTTSAQVSQPAPTPAPQADAPVPEWKRKPIPKTCPSCSQIWEFGEECPICNVKLVS